MEVNNMPEEVNNTQEQQEVQAQPTEAVKETKEASTKVEFTEAQQRTYQ